MKVKGVLEAHPGVFESSPMAGRAVEEFSAALEEIKAVAVRAGSDTTGETAAKKLAKERMAYVASALAACGAVFAVNSSDRELEASLQYSYSDIKYGLDNEALQIARAIESLLLDHRKELREYLVSDQDLEELHQRIEEYAQALVARGGAKSGAVSEHQRLGRLFKTTDALLEGKIDRFAFRLKKQFPKFYTAYNHARLIDDL